jgi:LacI family transcriptional regulator
MGTPLRVALLVESSHTFGRAVLQGIAAYAEAHGPWTFHHEERAFDALMPQGLKAWRPDGIIARVALPRLARQLERLRVPVVDLYEQNLVRGSSRVADNHRAVMRLAVDHLRSCGFQHLAYVGFPEAVFSRERARCFSDYVTACGFHPHFHQLPSSGRPRGLAAVEAAIRRHAGRLAQWLEELPKPAGVVACNDMMGQQVLAACSEHGIDVPDRIGVIGVDNDEVRCKLSSPSLSSVDPNAHRVGYEAAALLHRMITGRRRTPRSIVVDPTGVVPRRSTDVLAFADPDISEVVRYIREHACEGLKLPAVLNHAGVSRATLDRQFLRSLGHTARAEIVRVQVQRVCELLTTTDLPLKQVARRAGFRHLETMCRVVRRSTGQSPTEHRRASSRASS